MLTVSFVLVALALIFTTASAANRAPLWPAVLFLVLVELLERLPR